MEIQNNELYMRRCIELAKNGIGNVSPNPLVGCVIVYDNEIIGEGWHKKYGESHAEVNAINSVKNKSLLKNSTLYVNLEPCSHFGKTPPCADLIIKNKIPKVIIGNIDPFIEVSGKGIKKLENANCKVVTGVLDEECKELNKRFFTVVNKKRPYVILKWAETKDGFIDNNIDMSVKGAKISNNLSSIYVHKLRAENDSIIVGTNTAIVDNPTLDVRKWVGKNPIRLVIDKELKLSKDLALFSNEIKTIAFNKQLSEINDNIEYVKINFENTVEEILFELSKKQVQSLLVEGGAILLQSFIDSGLWDEAIIIISEKVFNDGVKAPKIKRILSTDELIGSDRIIKIVNR